MASLKEISQYPDNAISWAVSKLSVEERKSFAGTLKKLEKLLGEKPEKRNEKDRKLLSASELFQKHIIPTIIEGVRRLEHLDDRGQIQSMDINFDNMRTDFGRMSLDDLAYLHRQVEQMENHVQVIDNFFKYYRGLVYVAAHEKCTKEDFITWTQKQKVCQATVYKYMSFTTLIMRFPRLILCDLNFSQIVKHKERIIAYMNEEGNSKIAHQLSDSIEFNIGTSKITINNIESDIPHVKGVSFSVDWKMQDQYENIEQPDIESTQCDGAMTIEDKMDVLM